jgi:hypothetical protein
MSARPLKVDTTGSTMQSCGPSPFRSHNRRSWLEAAATACSESRPSTPTTSTSPHGSGKRGRISIEDMRRNTDYPGLREPCGLRARRSETGGAKFLPEARAEISISGDIESCAHSGKLAAISPTNTIPASKDFIRTSSSNSTSTKSTKSMMMPGEKCTSRNTAGPCYTNRNVTDFMEAKREHLTNGQAR